MKVVATLKMPRSAKRLIPFAQNIITCFTGNTALPSPNPPLATVTADLSALVTAEAAVLNRTKGAVETRDIKLATLRTDLEQLLAYVQQVASANPTSAAETIQSAGMSVRKTTLHDKAPLAASRGTASGDVILVAKAVSHRASYEWQYSTDGKTWTLAPATLQAKTVLSGLTAGTLYYFRVRPVLAAGEQNWSEVVSIVVL
jgi:hypothetical protein